MALTIPQIKAAQLLAKGTKNKDVWPAVGVSEGSLYAWLKRPEFNEMLNFFSAAELERAAVVAASQGNTDDIEQSRLDELELRQSIKPIAIELCAFVADSVRTMREQSTELVSPATLGRLVNSAVACVSLLREGNDRLAGIEALIDELGKINAHISVEAIQMSNSSASKAA